MRRVSLRGVLPGVVLMLGLVSTTGSARAQQLDETLQRVAGALHRGEAEAITRLSARAGISLDVDGNAVGPLGPRQAAAVLRRVFDDHETLSVRTTLMREVGGAPARAFGELTWNARARGITVPEQAKFFVAFVLEDGSWHITEIRLLR